MSCPYKSRKDICSYEKGLYCENELFVKEKCYQTLQNKIPLINKFQGVKESEARRKAIDSLIKQAKDLDW